MADLDGDEPGAGPRKFKLKKSSVAPEAPVTKDAPDEESIFSLPKEKEEPRRRTRTAATATTPEKHVKKCIECRKEINFGRIKAAVVAFPCKHVCHQKCAFVTSSETLACPRCQEDDSGDDSVYGDNVRALEAVMLPLPSAEETIEGPRLKFLTRYRMCRALAHDYHEQICVPYNENVAAKHHAGKITYSEAMKQLVPSKLFLSFMFKPLTIEVLRENRVRISSLLQKDVNFKELFDNKVIVVLRDLTTLSLTLADVTYNKELLSVSMIHDRFNGAIRPSDFTVEAGKPFLLRMFECMSIPEPKKRLVPSEVQRLNVNLLKEIKLLDRKQMKQARELFTRCLRLVVLDDWYKTLGLTSECLKLMKINPNDLRAVAIGSAPAQVYQTTGKLRRPYSEDKAPRRRRPVDSDDSTDNDDNDTTHGTDSD